MRFNESTGVIEWNKTYDATGGDDGARSVAVDSNDNVYTVGYGTNLNGSDTGGDWWVKQFNSSGVQDTNEWNKTFEGAGGTDRAQSVAVDSNDNVYVVGYGTNLNGSDTGSDWWIKKFEYFTGNFSTTSSTPIVVTNASTGVEETNATLHGYLQFEGHESCTVRFEYGTTTSYGTNTTNQTKNTGEEFSNGTGAPLSPGTLYHFRAYAENSINSDTGNDSVFLTKPQAPSSFTAATYNQTQIDLTWTKGDGANNTFIVRKKGSYPSDRTDGTNIYNGTGSSYSDTGLDQKKRYYYRAWSYTSWINNGTTYNQWSDSYDDDTAATTTLTLINCSTDKSVYGDGDTVTFDARVDADIGSTVVLLLTSSTTNLSSCDYTTRGSCIASSTNVTITSQPQTITATMSASGTGTSWYAKVCDSEGRNSYMYENTSAWNKTYNGGSATGNDIANSVSIDNNDNVYVVGYGMDLNDTSSSYDWWIMRFNGSTGVRDWNKTYSTAGSNLDISSSVTTDSINNVYVVGFGDDLNGSGTAIDWWIKKFNETGMEDTSQWNLTYNGGSITGWDRAYSVVVDSNNNVYVVGAGYNLNTSSGADWWIMRFNGSTGIRDWNKTYDNGAISQGDIARSVAIDSNDNVYVVGQGVYLNESDWADWWIMSFNGSTGVRDWNKTYSGVGTWNIPYSVETDSNNNVYVVGYGTNLNASDSGNDWWIMSFNGSTGVRDWNKTYDGSAAGDSARNVIIDSSDNVYISGYGYNLNGTSTGADWWIKKFNTTGVEDKSQWNITYDGGSAADASSMATDSDDNVYVVGYGSDLNGSSTNNDWWIKKFEHFTGSFSVVNETKQILTMSQSTYSLEINSASTTLTGYINSNSVSTSIDTNWHYVALTFDGSTMRLYKDGEEKNSGASGSITYPGTIPDVTAGLYLTGHLDELRISSTQRSSAWINTTFQNLNEPESFATFGSAVGVLSTWTYRKKITFNSSMIDADLSNFPVLIYTASDSDLKNNALSSGNDIIFLNSSASQNWRTETWRSKLDHEIEKYDDSTGELVAWVRIPTLSSSTDTEIYMYYNNSLCTSNRENITGVWDSNYIMVQHLQESSGSLLDSTSNDNDGTNVDGNATYNASAKIDGGYDFDGDGDYLQIPQDASLDFMEDKTYAWSFWIKPDLGSELPLLCEGDMYGGTGIYMFIDSSGYLVFQDEGESLLGQSETPVSDGVWSHIVFVYNEGELYIYINSIIDLESFWIDDHPVSDTVFIGRDYDDSNYFKGTIDEVRISNIARNSSWINTMFNNMNDPANFTTFGDQEIQNIAPVLSSPNPSDDATGEPLTPTLSITANDANADCLNLSWWSNSSGTWQQFGSASSSATNRFGYDTAGGSWVDINNSIRGSNFTCPANGTIDAIHGYMLVRGSIGTPPYWKGAIYYKSNNTLLNATQEYSQETIDSNPYWHTLSFSSPPTLIAGEEYYLVLWANTSAHPTNYARLYYDTHNSRRGFYQSQTYNGFPDLWSPTAENKVYSIYCTYNTSCLSNGTYYMDNLNFSSNGTAYYWSVNCTDGEDWTNSTYNFKTGGLYFGSSALFESDTPSYISAAAINSTHFVITYCDEGNSNYGTAIVGVVSGDSITYGNAAVFKSAATLYTSVTALNSTHVVIGYSDGGNSNYGTAIVGVVSGNSISFGSPVVFESAATNYVSVSALNNTHVVVGYEDDDNSNYGTAIVGVVSGNSISFGSPVVFESAATNYVSVSALNSTHVVIGYGDEGNSNYGTGVVGVVDGNSISYGSPVVFEEAITAAIAVSSLNSTHVIITFWDVANNGAARIGTVSGNSISYGSEAAFASNIAPYISTATLDDTHAVIIYGPSNINYGRIANILGNSISYSGSEIFSSGHESTYLSATSLDSSHFVIAYDKGGEDIAGYAVVGVYE